MQPAHKEVFFNAAEQFTCWIGLREPNDLADKWIGRHGYVPKGETCKAKTADNPFHALGGLVVDPTLCPDAFKPQTRQQALDSWRKFLVGGRLPAGYTRVESGKEKGLVKHNGAAIHADFDLMTLVRSGPQGEFLATDRAQLERLFADVVGVLNRGLRSKMIQHGPEFLFNGLGARPSESVLWFGPGRRFRQGPSSMPSKEAAH